MLIFNQPLCYINYNWVLTLVKDGQTLEYLYMRTIIYVRVKKNYSHSEVSIKYKKYDLFDDISEDELMKKIVCLPFF